MSSLATSASGYFFFIAQIYRNTVVDESSLSKMDAAPALLAEVTEWTYFVVYTGTGH